MSNETEIKELKQIIKDQDKKIDSLSMYLDGLFCSLHQAFPTALVNNGDTVFDLIKGIESESALYQLNDNLNKHNTEFSDIYQAIHNRNRYIKTLTDKKGLPYLDEFREDGAAYTIPYKARSVFSNTVYFVIRAIPDRLDIIISVTNDPAAKKPRVSIECYYKGYLGKVAEVEPPFQFLKFVAIDEIVEQIDRCLETAGLTLPKAIPENELRDNLNGLKTITIEHHEITEKDDGFYVRKIMTETDQFQPKQYTGYIQWGGLSPYIQEFLMLALDKSHQDTSGQGAV